MKNARLLCAALFLIGSPRASEATWSVVIADSVTQEIALGSVTCLGPFDLRALTPVMVVGLGGATVQAAGDFDGSRRPFIFFRILAGSPPQEILGELASFDGHGQRQYGIVDTLGRAVSFTGGATARWAGGVTGQVGHLSYALQGNILAGPCVVPAMENAILTTPGDVPEKLMQAMAAARVTGGDGRCSCMGMVSPVACGCPPPFFNKSGHIGYMITARIGDTDDPSCNDNGCADGNYFMSLNVPFQFLPDPDPVFQLGQMFRVWRAALIGRPDAIQSSVTISQQGLGSEMAIQLDDWQGLPVETGSVSLIVEHANDSDAVHTIGDVIEEGNGLYRVALTPAGVGIDRFRITANDGVRPVVLMPFPALCVADVAGGLSRDCNGNGLSDECEIFAGTIADIDRNGSPDPCEHFLRGDCDANGAVLTADAIQALRHLFDGHTSVVCQKACDTDNDGRLNIQDPVLLLRFFLLAGPPPSPPFRECGFDSGPDNLTCKLPFPPCL